MSNTVAFCDYNHQTVCEVRRIPLPGDAGLFLCHYHYCIEREEQRDVRQVELPDFYACPLQEE